MRAVGIRSRSRPHALHLRCRMPVFSLALTTEAVKESKYFERKSERKRERVSERESLFGTILDNGSSRRAGLVCALGCGDRHQRLSLETSGHMLRVSALN